MFLVQKREAFRIEQVSGRCTCCLKFRYMQYAVDSKPHCDSCITMLRRKKEIEIIIPQQPEKEKVVRIARPRQPRPPKIKTLYDASAYKNEVLNVLKNAEKPHTYLSIQEVTGFADCTVKRWLRELREEGLAVSKYVHKLSIWVSVGNEHLLDIPIGQIALNPTQTPRSRIQNPYNPSEITTILAHSHRKAILNFILNSDAPVTTAEVIEKLNTNWNRALWYLRELEQYGLVCRDKICYSKWIDVDRERLLYLTKEIKSLGKNSPNGCRKLVTALTQVNKALTGTEITELVGFSGTYLYKNLRWLIDNGIIEKYTLLSQKTSYYALKSNSESIKHLNKIHRNSPEETIKRFLADGEKFANAIYAKVYERCGCIPRTTKRILKTLETNGVVVRHDYKRTYKRFGFTLNEDRQTD